MQQLVRKVRADNPAPVGVTVSGLEDGGISISLPQNLKGGSDVWLVTFIRENTTQVVRGENHGKTLTSHNIVRKVRHVVAWDGKVASFDLSRDELELEAGQGCAILIQDERPGPVLGAAYCPDNVGVSS